MSKSQDPGSDSPKESERSSMIEESSDRKNKHLQEGFLFESRKKKKSNADADLNPQVSNAIPRCTRHCFLFPPDCDFDKDAMVQLWVAEGIFDHMMSPTIEDLAGSVFDSILARNSIVPSRFDNVCGLWKYKCAENRRSSILRADDYSILKETGLAPTSMRTKHISLICNKFEPHTLEFLKEFKELRTLVLLSENGSSMNHLPHDMFLYLKHLTTIDLHEFHISELPSSIGNLQSLRYLDVSGSSIRYLPESIGSLACLQTLKLKGCLELHELPNNTKKLINLRHLDLDVLGQLRSMPSGMGSLMNLRTLREFLVGTEDGCRVGELKNLINLTGTICISGLENISNSNEAGEAQLSNKKNLIKLELQWSDHHNRIQVEEEILECLQPHFGIKELDIFFFNGTRLPSWISNSAFTEIVSISINHCKNCSLLPSLGRLPSLKFLEIYEMSGIRVIDHSFCGNDGDQESQAFPKLEKLTIDGMLNLEGWTGVRVGDFPSLLEFKLKYCPKLLFVPFLSKLQSMKFLEIIECTELKCLSEDALPASLETLIVKDCPSIRERCSSRNAQDWSKIAHIPSLLLDHEEIFPKKLMTEDLNS